MDSCPLIHDCGLIHDGIISTHCIVNYSIFRAINLSNISVQLLFKKLHTNFDPLPGLNVLVMCALWKTVVRVVFTFVGHMLHE